MGEGAGAYKVFFFCPFVHSKTTAALDVSYETKRRSINIPLRSSEFLLDSRSAQQDSILKRDEKRICKKENSSAFQIESRWPPTGNGVPRDIFLCDVDSNRSSPVFHLFFSPLTVTDRGSLGTRSSLASIVSSPSPLGN